MELTTPLQGAPLNRLAPEIISKIFVAVMDITPIATRLNETLRSASKMPMLLCHVSSFWRHVAFTTPELWEHLCAFFPIYSIEEPDQETMEIDKVLVRNRDLDFLTWWSRNLMQGRNAFALRLYLDHRSLSQTSSSRAISPFVAEDMHTLLNLASRARYLDTDSTFFPFLQELMPAAFSDGEIYAAGSQGFPFLESLVITEKESYTTYDHQFQQIPFHNMQALRRICLTNISLDDPIGTDITHLGARYALAMMWARLTHVHLTLQVTIATWQTFIRGFTSLESARFHVFLHDGLGDEDMDTEPDLILEDKAGPDLICLPKIRELSFTIEYTDNKDDTGKLFDNIHLPSLKTLLLWCNIMTLKSFHRLLGATPNVEQIRLCSQFPAVAVDDPDSFTELFDVDYGYYLHFPCLDGKESSHQVNTGRLAHYTPHLKKIMLDVPNTRQFKRSVRGYLQNMVRSGWLRGPWKNRPLEVEFYWIWLSERVDQWPVIQDLKRSLADGAFWSENGDSENVNIRAKVRYDLGHLTNSEAEDLPLWQQWFRLEAEF